MNWATANSAMDRVKSYRANIDNLTEIISAVERRHQTLAAIGDELRNRKSNGK